MSDENSFVKAAAVGILAIILLVPLMMYEIWANAYVGSTLWGWFIVPVFGLPALTLPQAWGISLVVGLWTKEIHTWKAKDERPIAAKIGEVIGSLLMPWFMLIIGWVCHHYYMVAN